jgi:hypothetical protein
MEPSVELELTLNASSIACYLYQAIRDTTVSSVDKSSPDVSKERNRVRSIVLRAIAAIAAMRTSA